MLNVYLDNGLEYDEESDRLTKNLHYKEDPDTSALSFYTRYLFADPRYALAKLKALRTDTILPQTFDVFDEQTGCYDKRVRDAEPIGAMDSYLERYPVFTDYPHQSLSLPYTDACMQSVAAIKARCEAAGVNLVVVAGPVYAEYLQTIRQRTSRSSIRRWPPSRRTGTFRRAASAASRGISMTARTSATTWAR